MTSPVSETDGEVIKEKRGEEKKKRERYEHQGQAKSVASMCHSQDGWLAYANENWSLFIQTSGA